MVDMSLAPLIVAVRATLARVGKGVPRAAGPADGTSPHRREQRNDLRMAPTVCENCGARVAAVDGPTHPYMVSAPGCWAGFGELQAAEMARFRYPPAHGTVVDAYAASHGGDGTARRDRQSVFIHLMAICAVTERGIGAPRRIALLQRATAGHPDFPLLARPAGHPSLSFTHLLGAGDADAYDTCAREWAAAVWAFWAPEHARIRAAVDAAMIPGAHASRSGRHRA
jgi:hypothetical protein